jgi:hypothetical protein
VSVDRARKDAAEARAELHPGHYFTTDSLVTSPSDENHDPECAGCTIERLAGHVDVLVSELEAAQKRIEQDRVAVS